MFDLVEPIDGKLFVSLRELDHAQTHIGRVGQKVRARIFSKQHQVLFVVELGLFIHLRLFGKHAQHEDRARLVLAFGFNARELGGKLFSFSRL